MRQEFEEIDGNAIMDRLIQREVSLKNCFVPHHLGIEEVGIVTDILIVDDLAPHRKGFHIFYLCSFDLVDEIVTAITIDGLQF